MKFSDPIEIQLKFDDPIQTIKILMKIPRAQKKFTLDF